MPHAKYIVVLAPRFGERFTVSVEVKAMSSDEAERFAREMVNQREIWSTEHVYKDVS